MHPERYQLLKHLSNQLAFEKSEAFYFDTSAGSTVGIFKCFRPVLSHLALFLCTRVIYSVFLSQENIHADFNIDMSFSKEDIKGIWSALTLTRSNGLESVRLRLERKL